MYYTVASRGSRYLEVYNELQDPIGSLELGLWRTTKATIKTVGGLEYHVTPVGFWQTTIEITKGDIPIATLKPVMGWSLGLNFGHDLHGYRLKKKSFWSSGYKLVDDNEQELATIQPVFKWRSFSYQYDIEIHNNVLDKETKLLLPFLLAYCARYMRMRQAAAA